MLRKTVTKQIYEDCRRYIMDDTGMLYVKKDCNETNLRRLQAIINIMDYVGGTSHANFQSLSSQIIGCASDFRFT